MQERAHAAMKRDTRVGQHHAITVAIEKPQAELALQILDRREDGGVGAPQLRCRCLEASFRNNRVEALQL